MIAVWLLAGAAWGAVAMLTLRWTVDRVQPRATGRALLLLGGGFVLRLAIAALVLLAALRQSIIAAALALAGMLVTRSVWLLIAMRRDSASDSAALGEG
jgi:hypothetical protein